MEVNSERNVEDALFYLQKRTSFVKKITEWMKESFNKYQLVEQQRELHISLHHILCDLELH